MRTFVGYGKCFRFCACCGGGCRCRRLFDNSRSGFLHIHTFLPAAARAPQTPPSPDLTRNLAQLLRERHEHHEKGLRRDLEFKAKACKASLQRRRNLRRSVSQGPETFRKLSCSPRHPMTPQAQRKGRPREGLDDVGGVVDTRLGIIGDFKALALASATSEGRIDVSRHMKTTVKVLSLTVAIDLMKLYGTPSCFLPPPPHEPVPAVISNCAGCFCPRVWAFLARYMYCCSCQRLCVSQAR